MNRTSTKNVDIIIEKNTFGGTVGTKFETLHNFHETLNKVHETNKVHCVKH